MMRALFLFICVSLVGNQVLSFSFGNGIRISALDISVGLFVVGWLIHRKLRIDQEIKWWLKVVGPFIGTGVISLFAALSRLPIEQVMTGSLYLLRFAVYSLVLPIISTNPELKKISLTGLWYSGIVIAILGLIQYFIYPNLRNLAYLGWDPHQYRVFGTLLDPNFTGIILVLTLILSYYLWQNDQFKKGVPQKIVLLVSILTFSSLMLTYSRGSYIAFLVSLSFLILHKGKGIYLILVGAIFLVLIVLLPRPGGEGVNLLRTMSIESRFENSQEALNIWQKSPVFGAGFDTLRFIRGQGEIVPGTVDVSHSGAGFHNSWLFILATSGLAGLLTYIWMWWNLLKNKSELLLVSFVAVGVHSFFDNSLFFPAVMLWIWVLLGSLIKITPKTHNSSAAQTYIPA